jgi:cytochrome c553
MKKTISRLHHSILMTSVMAGFLVFSVSLAFAQHEDSAAKEKDHLHHHHFAQLAKVPEKARLRHNPLESDPDAMAAGRKLFEQHCAECHGNTAEGGKKAPSLRAEEVQQATPGTLFWILTNGVVRRGMPVWSKLPEPQRWQIVTYLKSLGPGEKSHNEGESSLTGEDTHSNPRAAGGGQKR